MFLYFQLKKEFTMSESGEMGTTETKINWKQGMVSAFNDNILYSKTTVHSGNVVLIPRSKISAHLSQEAKPKADSNLKQVLDIKATLVLLMSSNEFLFTVLYPGTCCVYKTFPNATLNRSNFS